MAPFSVVFFGSFQSYSSLVLSSLLAAEIEVIGVVTTPPHPQGRKKVLTPNPVHQVALDEQVPVLTPEILDANALSDLQALGKADFMVTAGYGKLLPEEWLKWPAFAALNVHFSLLPKFRGANPAEWAILMNERETGVSVIEMSPEFDTGKVVSQAVVPLESDETRESCYEKLYRLGGELVIPTLHHYFSWKNGQQPPTHEAGFSFFLPALTQSESPTPYAKRLQRQDGFLPWQVIKAAMNGEASNTAVVSDTLQKILPAQLTPEFIARMTRALGGFPSLWTELPTAKGSKRMKILQTRLENNCLVVEKVQIEGQQTAAWNQVKNQVK